MYILKRFLGNEFNEFNAIIDKYNEEQNSYINLEACVSYPFQEVLDVQAMPFATITTEGTRKNRYFPMVDSLESIEDYAEKLALKLFNINDSLYSVNIQPNSGTQANQIVYNAILKNGDKILALSPKDGGHISHTKLGCRDIHPYYFTLDNNLEVNYVHLEEMIKSINPQLVIVGASSYIKEFNYKKIYEITSKYGVPLMADICHSVLYIMGGIHQTIFPYVDFATFTMEKLLCGPQGGVVIYKNTYEKQINLSTFPKTQGGPIQNALFAKAMCFLKLAQINVNKYANQVIENCNTLISRLKCNGIPVINSHAYNHIILIDVLQKQYTGLEAEKKLYKNGILCNRNQIPNDINNAMITSGIRMGTTTITNLNYSYLDIEYLGDYISSILLSETPQLEVFNYLIDKYHKNINISS